MSAKQRERNVEQAIVDAIATGGLRSITVEGQTYDVAIRATWLDDADGGTGEDSAPEETKAFPCILIDAGCAYSEEALRNGPAWVVPLRMAVMTWHDDDKKQRVGCAIYESLRGILEAEGLTLGTGDFDALTIDGSDQFWEIAGEANVMQILARVNMHD